MSRGGTGRNGSVTMNDVAQRAGVSIKTVSNVVNNYPHIAESTRTRVEKAIAELGYRVNLSARNLRHGRTGMIGLALPELSLPYFAELADSIIGEAEQHGVVVLIEQTGAVREREVEALQGHRRQLTDGLLFSPLALGPGDHDLIRVNYPLVLLGERIFNASADHVTMANVDAARAATEYLIAHGRRNIAVVGAHPGEDVGSAALRMEGYRTALADAGIPYEPRLVAASELWHRETGKRAMDRLLDDGIEFDAVFGLNDALALGALHALRARDVRVPQDVAVIGFDDVNEASYSAPPLTSVAPGREQIAREAVRLLLKRINKPARGGWTQIVADYDIKVRESTAGSR